MKLRIIGFLLLSTLIHSKTVRAENLIENKIAAAHFFAIELLNNTIKFRKLANKPYGLLEDMLTEITDQKYVYFNPQQTQPNDCEPRGMGFVVHGEDLVYFCKLGTTKSIPEMAQTIIHEVVHLLGVRDECDASLVEYTVMIESGYGIQYENSYMKECGLRI